jgi:NitT/TauT family transport system substrate-binding protein
VHSEDLDLATHRRDKFHFKSFFPVEVTLRSIKSASSLAFVVALLVLSTVGCRFHRVDDSSGLTPVRLQLDWYPQPEHGGFYTALLQGYYKAEGLDVTLLPLPQYGSVAQLVSTGKAEFGLGSSDQILEWDSNGLPLEAVAATMQHDPQAIMVHKDSPVRDFKDLEGRTIAAQTGATWLKYVIARYNLHQVRQVPSTLSIANFLADPAYVQQIFVTSEPFFVKQTGAEVRTFLISTSGYDPYRVQFTTHKFAAEHPDIVTRFVRASVRGWQEYLRNPGPTNDHLLKLNPALNSSQEAYTAQALNNGNFITGSDSNPQTGRMTAQRWQATYEQLKSLGILQGQLDPTTAYSLKFLQ